MEGTNGKTYLVLFSVSSPHHHNGSRQVSGQTTEINYKFKKEMRNKIGAIGSDIRRKVYKNTLEFNGARLCNTGMVSTIQDDIRKVDEELKKLDKKLYARVFFLPLDIGEMETGELRGQFEYAIKHRILSELIGLLDTNSTKMGIGLSSKSKTALDRKIERLRAFNIMNDPGFDRRLTEIKSKILDVDIEFTRKAWETELKQLTTQACFCEICGKCCPDDKHIDDGFCMECYNGNKVRFSNITFCGACGSKNIKKSGRYSLNPYESDYGYTCGDCGYSAP